MQNLTVKSTLLDPYSQYIRDFVVREFPAVAIKSQRQMLDSLTEAIVATGQVRLGPRPSPEALVAIRQVISHYTAQNQPVPFLMPWGSEKPDGSSIDIAELGALKTLICLSDRVKRQYEPGIVINIRIEDASAPHLFYDRADKARAEAARYTGDFTTLIRVLGIDSFIHARPESVMTTEPEFNKTADTILPVMLAHLKARTICLDPGQAESSAAMLNNLGFRGAIEDETIEFYLEQYAKQYADKPMGERVHILARYLAAAMARRQMKIRGDDPAWNGQYIDLSFAQAAPGTESYFAKRILYRTFPASLTANHQTPTRAKGYLLIQSRGGIKPQLGSFRDTLPLNKHVLTLTNGKESVNVQADYMIENDTLMEPVERTFTGVL